MKYLAMYNVSYSVLVAALEAEIHAKKLLADNGKYETKRQLFAFIDEFDDQSINMNSHSSYDLVQKKIDKDENLVTYKLTCKNDSFTKDLEFSQPLLIW